MRIVSNPMRRDLVTAAILGLLFVSISGCGGGSPPGPERATVKGKVTLDGQPVNGGSITFLPADTTKGRVSGGQIQNGEYSFTGDLGPTLGEQTVKINWQKPTGKKAKDMDTGNELDETAEVIPNKYHVQSQEKRTIKAGENSFDFDLKSK